MVFPLLLAAAEVTIISRNQDRASPALTWVHLLRPAATLGLTGAGYIVMRWIVTGSLRGDSPTFVLAHAPFAMRLCTMLGALPTILSLLVWPAHQAVEYMPQALAVHHSFDIALLWPAALLASLISAAVAARRSAPVVTFGIMWTALTRLPASNILMPTGIVLAPRVLFLPSVGAVLAAGGVIAWLAGRLTRVRWGVPLWRAVTATGLPLLLVLGVWASESRVRVWRDDLTLVSRTAVDAPRSYLARYQWGRALFQLGRSAEGEREMRAAIALFPGDPRPYIDLAFCVQSSKDMRSGDGPVSASARSFGFAARCTRRTRRVSRPHR